MELENRYTKRGWNKSNSCFKYSFSNSWCIFYYGLDGLGLMVDSVGSIASKENADAVALQLWIQIQQVLAGAIMVSLIMYLKYRKLDLTMILNGALGGLVAITKQDLIYMIFILLF